MSITKSTKQKQDESWFIFGSCLSQHLFSDYICLRFNFYFERIAFVQPNVVKMVEVVEKSLKLYLTFQEKKEKSLSYFSSDFGHSLEKLRSKAETFNPLFSELDIVSFTKPFDDKAGNLFQKLRYGSHGTVEGFKANPDALMKTADKVFFGVLLALEEPWRKMLIGNSTLYFLMVNSESSQCNNRELLIQSLQIDNPYFQTFANVCNEIKNEQDLINSAITNQTVQS